MANCEFLSKLTNEEIAHYFEMMCCLRYDVCDFCPLSDARLFGTDCGHEEITDWLGKEHIDEGCE